MDSGGLEHFVLLLRFKSFSRVAERLLKHLKAFVI